MKRNRTPVITSVHSRVQEIPEREVPNTSADDNKLTGAPSLHGIKKRKKPKNKKKRYACQQCAKRLKTELGRWQHQHSVHSRIQEVLEKQALMKPVAPTVLGREHLLFPQNAQVKTLTKEQALATSVDDKRHNSAVGLERHRHQTENSTTAADSAVQDLKVLTYDREKEVSAVEQRESAARVTVQDNGRERALFLGSTKERSKSETVADEIAPASPFSDVLHGLAEERLDGIRDDCSVPNNIAKSAEVNNTIVREDEKVETSMSKFSRNPISEYTSRRKVGEYIAIPIGTGPGSVISERSNVDYFNDWAKTIDRSTASQEASSQNESTNAAQYKISNPAELPLFDRSQPGYEPTTAPETPTILRCDVEGCEAVYLGGDRSADLTRHKRQAHQGFYPQYTCGDEHCGRVFRTLDARLQHYESEHPYIAAELSSRLQKLSSSLAGPLPPGTLVSYVSSPDSDKNVLASFWHCCDCGDGPHPYNRLYCNRCSQGRCAACQFGFTPRPSSVARSRGLWNCASCDRTIADDLAWCPFCSEQFRSVYALDRSENEIETEKGPSEYPQARQEQSSNQNPTIFQLSTSGQPRARKRTTPGCITCQERRIKCGEERPWCENCTKSKRQCEGYNARMVFETPIEHWPNDPGSISPFQDHSSMRPGLHYQPYQNSPWAQSQDKLHSLSGSDALATVSLQSLFVQARLTKVSDAQYLFTSDDRNNSSAASSYAASVASVFSVESLASSASELSKNSGYSAIQIATATKVLISIFHEDEVLLPLYQSAVMNPSIGHERLERNLRRLLKAYARQVKGEAGDHIEYLASHLVLVKAPWLARSIVEKLQTQPECERSDSVERDSESSEDEAEKRPVNEAAFENLSTLRDFLTKSQAFEVLRAQVHAFVLPRDPRPSHVGKSRQEEDDCALSENATLRLPARTKEAARLRSWEKWRADVVDTVDTYLCNRDKLLASTAPLYLLTDGMILVTDRIMTAVGLLERPLQAELVRLRWSCGCRETHYSDVKELRDGGITELIAHMERSSGVKVSASSYRQHSGNQQYVAPQPGRWLRNGIAKLTSVFGTSKTSPCLPRHTNTCSSSVSTASSTTISPPSMLHLLACMHHNRFRKVLQQDRIEAIKTDRALLCFMRRQHARYRCRLLRFLSLKGVQGIYFVKFRLPLGGSVDVRHHDPCCLAISSATQTGCECIPPKGKVEPSPEAEYRCIPGPPATYPPVPPEYLKSLFMCPTNVHEQDTWILDQLPKRICGELQGRAGQPADGWGIYYQEGWDFDVIISFVFVIFFLASSLFGVLWSVFKYDVQGAFVVSAYMITASGILVAVFASRIEKMG
ncbi:hypothetical protein BKA63DRAFT_258683 [Paraphoma chrysanthemicola]|nr:hypothetical protein BKA63DRAFT_258683 [Paraphoma chrysanthemicola]